MAKKDNDEKVLFEQVSEPVSDAWKKYQALDDELDELKLKLHRAARKGHDRDEEAEIHLKRLMYQRDIAKEQCWLLVDETYNTWHQCVGIRDNDHGGLCLVECPNHGFGGLLEILRGGR